MARDWRVVVDEMPRVQRLVHLMIRYDTVDEDATRAELLRVRRRAYEDELTIQAARVGCPGRSGRLVNASVLAELNQMCADDARSIANTYNYDLAGAISRIRSETPTANRFTYAARLREWETARAKWKTPQIAQYTENSARSLAQQHFSAFNADVFGFAVLEPRQAVCPVCQGWIARGEVPLNVAMNNPPPYHPGCPHAWRTVYDKVSRDVCPRLWMGE